MDLLQRAAQQEIRQRATSSAQQADVILINDPRDPSESWRRLMLRVLVTIQTARCQVVLAELRDVTLNKKLDESPTSDSHAQEGPRLVPRTEIMLRNPLALSKSHVWFCFKGRAGFCGGLIMKANTDIRHVFD